MARPLSTKSTTDMFTDAVPRRSAVDHVLNVAMGPLPIEIVQLRSWGLRLGMRLLLVGGFLGALSYFVLKTAQSQRKSVFVSLSRDAGKCKRTLTPTISGTYALDLDGKWSTNPEYAATASVLRVEFNHFPTKDYGRAIRDAADAIAGLPPMSMMDNVLRALAWKHRVDSTDEGKGSAVFTFAADAGAVFDAKTVYVGMTGCPSANYQSSYQWQWGYQTDVNDRYEYHVDQDAAAGTTRISWVREALDLCTTGATGISVANLLGCYLANTDVVDSQLALDVDWFSVVVAAALNAGVLDDPTFMEELDSELFNFHTQDSTDDSNNSSDAVLEYCEWYRELYYDPAGAFETFVNDAMFQNWSEYVNVPYEVAAEFFCPKHYPSEFASETAPADNLRFFTDSRVPGMAPVACSLTADHGWVCSIVLGNIHAYPFVQIWADECNFCSADVPLNTSDQVDACAGDGRFQPDFTGGLFIKPVSRGPFLAHPWADRDDYWRTVATGDQPTLSRLSRYASWFLQTDNPDRSTEWSIYSDVATAACTLDYNSTFVAFNNYESDGNAVSINADGNTAHPSTWHCTSAWSDEVAAALLKVTANSKSPTTLFENYYECNTKPLQRWIYALGVGVANAETLFILLSFCITAILLEAVARYRSRWLTHGVLVTEDDVQDNNLLQAFKAKYRKVRQHDDEEDYDEDGGEDKTRGGVPRLDSDYGGFVIHPNDDVRPEAKEAPEAA